MPGTAVLQVVAVAAGDDDVGELQHRDGLGEVARLVGVGRERPAVRDVAERTAPRADVAQDHEGRGALAEALADVRARGFLADGVQLLLAQDALDVVEARIGRGRAYADPGGLGQHVRARHDPDRLLRALFLYARFTHFPGSRGKLSQDRFPFAKASLKSRGPSSA